MTTLRRELIQRFKTILESRNAHDEDDLLSEELADSALELRGFQFPLPKDQFEKEYLGTFSDEDREEVLRKSGIEWQIAAGMEVKQDQIDEAVIVKEATDEFERALHFNPLPWNSTKPWEKLSNFVVQEYKKDKDIWKKYDAWRKSDGKFAGAMNNKNINLRPTDFIACFPDFLAHTAMYKPRKVVSNDERTDLDETGAPISY